MRAHTINKTRRGRHAWCSALLIVLAVCVLAVPASASAAQSPTSATVQDWNLYATNALGNPPTAPVMPGVGQAPHVSVLHVGMVQGAVFDAVNAIDGGHRPYLVAPAADRSDSKDAAAATAAHDVLVGLEVGGAPMLSQPVRDWLDAAYAESLAAVPDGPAKTGGIAAGGGAAEAMLAPRPKDGRLDPFTVLEGTDPGEWRKMPPHYGGEPGPGGGD